MKALHASNPIVQAHNRAAHAACDVSRHLTNNTVSNVAEAAAGDTLQPLTLWM